MRYDAQSYKFDCYAVYGFIIWKPNFNVKGLSL